MAADQAQVQQAPISCPRPELGPESTTATIILAGMAVLAVHLVFYLWPDLSPR